MITGGGRRKRSRTADMSSRHAAASDISAAHNGLICTAFSVDTRTVAFSSADERTSGGQHSPEAAARLALRTLYNDHHHTIISSRPATQRCSVGLLIIVLSEATYLRVVLCPK